MANNKKQIKNKLAKKALSPAKSKKAKKQQKKAKEKLQRISKQENRAVINSKEVQAERRRESKQYEVRDQQNYRSYQKTTFGYHHLTADQYIKYLSTLQYDMDPRSAINKESFEVIRKLYEKDYDYYYQGLLGEFPDKVWIIPTGENVSETIPREGNINALMIVSSSGYGQARDTYSIRPEITIRKIQKGVAKLLHITKDETYSETFDKVAAFYSSKPGAYVGDRMIFIQLLGVFYEEGNQ